MAFVTDKSSNIPNEWRIVDEENGALLEYIDCHEAYYGFFLHWKDQRIRIGVLNKSYKNNDLKLVALWQVKRVDIPTSLKTEKEAIITLFKDAIREWEESQFQIIDSITVDFEGATGL